MMIRLAKPDEFNEIRNLYWELIDLMRFQNDTIGWKKGIYPSDLFLANSIERKELYVRYRGESCVAAFILNSSCNEGYSGIPWKIRCSEDDVLIPHALAVHPSVQGSGIGKELVSDIIDLGRASGKKALRLDILGTNIIAEKLYTGAGFQFVQAEALFYEDTGLTEYKMFELAL